MQGQETAFTSLFEANEVEEIFEHITGKLLKLISTSSCTVNEGNSVGLKSLLAY